MVQIMEKVTLDGAQETEAVKDKKDKEPSAGPSSCNSTEVSSENASDNTVSVSIYDNFLILTEDPLGLAHQILEKSQNPSKFAKKRVFWDKISNS